MRTGIALGALLLLAGCGGEPYSPNNPAEAEAQCEGFADQRLKAPATADYDLNASQTTSGWTVVGTVDSENGFGAKVRSNVTCVLHFEGNTAHLDDIAID